MFGEHPIWGRYSGRDNEDARRLHPVPPISALSSPNRTTVKDQRARDGWQVPHACRESSLSASVNDGLMKAQGCGAQSITNARLPSGSRHGARTRRGPLGVSNWSKPKILFPSLAPESWRRQGTTGKGALPAVVVVGDERLLRIDISVFGGRPGGMPTMAP